MKEICLNRPRTQSLLAPPRAIKPRATELLGSLGCTNPYNQWWVEAKRMTSRIQVSSGHPGRAQRRARVFPKGGGARTHWQHLLGSNPIPEVEWTDLACSLNIFGCVRPARYLGGVCPVAHHCQESSPVSQKRCFPLDLWHLGAVETRRTTANWMFSP